MPRGRDDEGTRRDPQPCRDPGVPGGTGRTGRSPAGAIDGWPASSPAASVDGPTERMHREAESERLESEQIEMARIDLAPIDLAALTADDELIDALSAGLLDADDLFPEPIGPDDELVAMLAAWVADVDGGSVAPDPEQAPVPSSRAAAAPDAPVETPVQALATAEQPATGLRVGPIGRTGTADVWPRRVRAAASAAGRGRHRARVTPYTTRMAAAAALVVMASSGVLIGAKQAQPGEALWTVSKVFYGERARSVEAAAVTDEALHAAHLAIAEGRTADAAQAIALAAAQLPLVRPDEGHDQLAAEHEQLVVDLATLAGTGLAPGPTVDRRTLLPSDSPLAVAPSPTVPATATPAPVVATPAPTPVTSPDPLLAAPAGAAESATEGEPDAAQTIAQPAAQAVTQAAAQAVADAVEDAANAAAQLGTATSHVPVPVRINMAPSSAPAVDDETPTEQLPTQEPPVETTQPAPETTDDTPAPAGQSEPPAQVPAEVFVAPPDPVAPEPEPVQPDPAPPTTPLDAVPPASPVVDPDPTGTPATDTPATDTAAETVLFAAVAPESPTVQMTAVPAAGPAPEEADAGRGRHAAPDQPDEADGGADRSGPFSDQPGRHAAPDPEVLA